MWHDLQRSWTTPLMQSVTTAASCRAQPWHPPEPQVSCLARDNLTLPPSGWRVVPKPCGSSSLKELFMGAGLVPPGGPLNSQSQTP